MQILLVDDEALITQGLAAFLHNLGHEVTCARNGDEALASLQTVTFHLVLTDIKMPGLDGISLLNEIKEQGIAVNVIAVTGHGDEEMAIRALRAGAFDYLKKPINLEELVLALERSEEHLRLKTENQVLTTKFDAEVEIRTAPLRAQVRQMEQALRSEFGLDKVHIFSPTTRRVFDQAGLFRLKRDVPVLIEGESGTGKELVARYLHHGDSSTPGPFIALNCAAMPSELFQSELFGYAGGSFTGARAEGSPGKLELAQGGTLFLDEIGDIPLEFQIHLLRVLETREYYRVGGLKKLKADARFVFATNQHMTDAVASGRFRRDLYHRINVGHIFIPPLRERREEILPLAQAFLQEFNIKHNKHFEAFSKHAEQNLMAQDWEGNVRELRNTIERAVILYNNVELKSAALGDFGTSSQTPPTDPTLGDLPPDGFNLLDHELEIVRRALAIHNDNKTQTAKYLGLSLKALQSRLRKL